MSLINQNTYLILLIEDNPADARLIKEMFRDEIDFSFDLIWKENLSDGLNYLKNNSIDITLLDLALPDSQGIDTFYKTYAVKPDSPIILLTGLNDKILALNAIEKGAQDFILKGQVDGNLLTRSILHAIERQRMLMRLKESEKTLLFKVRQFV